MRIANSRSGEGFVAISPEARKKFWLDRKRTAAISKHTNAFKIVIVSGTFVQTPEGKPEFRLGPGSYLMQPGGNYKHTTACDKASDCVFFTQANGKFDLKPVEAAKAPAKK